MKVVSYSVDESLVDSLYSIDFFHLNNDWAHTINDLVFIFGKPQVRNFTSVKEVVDIFNECLRNDLSVSHKETNWFSIDTSGEHEFLHEILELGRSKVLSDFNLLELNFSHMRSKLCEGLFTGTTDSDKHDISAWLF